MNDKVINEAFVEELLKSGVWDVARARPEPLEESARATAEDKAKSKADRLEKEKSQREWTSTEIAEDLVKNLDEEVILEFVNLLHNVLNESEDDREATPEMKLAEELFQGLDEETINEFVSLLYTLALNESKEKESKEIDEKYTDLFAAINDSFKSLNEEYDLTDSTTEDIMEAIVDSLDADDVEDYSAEEIMEALIYFLDEDEQTDTARKEAEGRIAKSEKSGGLTKLGAESMRKRVEAGEQDPTAHQRKTGVFKR